MHYNIIRKLIPPLKSYSELASRPLPVSQLQRFITTKQPTKSTAAAVKPVHVEDNLNDPNVSLLSQIETNKCETSLSSVTYPTDTVSHKKWQSLVMKQKHIKTEELPVHTCETYEEFTDRQRRTFFRYAPDADDADQLPPGEWRSVFHLFTRTKGMSLENIQLMRSILGADKAALREYNEERKWLNMIEDQTIRLERLEALGPNLAAAHFLVFRGAKVRFHGQEDWVVGEEGSNENSLPRFRQDRLHLKDVDASSVKICYEGLENLGGCTALESINLSASPLVDNFFLDRICHQHHDSLLHLDISDCTLISLGGITSLVRLRKLRSLNVRGIRIAHLALACITLEDELPGLQVTGVDYDSSELPDKQVQLVMKRLRDGHIRLGDVKDRRPEDEQHAR